MFCISLVLINIMYTVPRPCAHRRFIASADTKLSSDVTSVRTQYFPPTFCYHVLSCCCIVCDKINYRLSASTFTLNSITNGIWTLC